MSRLQLVVRGLLVASILATTACSGGGGGDFIGPDRVDRADSQTRFDVTVDDEGQTTAQHQPAQSDIFVQLKQFILPDAWAAPVPGAEILIAYISEDGVVIDILSADDGLVVNDNGDGTYTVIMPDDPRVDGMIVTNPTLGTSLDVGQQLPDGSFYAPAVGEDVELSPGATAATRVALNYINNFDAVTNDMMEDLVANLTAAAADLIEQGQGDSLVAELDASYGNYVINTLLQAQQEIIADVSGYNGEYFEFAQHDVLLANATVYTQQQLWDIGLSSLSVSPALQDGDGNLLPVNVGALSFQNRQAETTQAASQVDYGAVWTRSEPSASWTAFSTNHNSIRDSGQIRIKLPEQSLTLAGEPLTLNTSELLAYGTKATTGAIVGSTVADASYANTSSSGHNHINPWILIPRATNFDIASLTGRYGAIFNYRHPQDGEVHRYISGSQLFNATSGSFTSDSTYNANTISMTTDGSIDAEVAAVDLGSFTFTAQANGVLSGGFGDNPVSVSAPNARFIHSAFGVDQADSKQGRLSLIKVAQGSNTEPLTFNTLANKIYAIVGNHHILRDKQLDSGAYTGTIHFTDVENTSYISAQSQTSGLMLGTALVSDPAQAVNNNLIVSNQFITGTTISNNGELSFNAGPRVFRGFIQEGANLLVLHSFINTTEGGERLDDVNLYAVCIKGCTTTMEGQSFSFSASVSGASADLQVQLDQNAVETIAQGSSQFTSANSISYGSEYNFVITSAPAGQACSVTNATAVAIADVDNVAIDCVNTYSIAGSVSGLSAPVTLALNNADFESLVVSADGNFSFSNTIDQDQNYEVLVAAQPSGQLCTVSNATGAATANVSDVAVVCTAAFTLGGTITGLSGDIGLSVNGGATVTLSANGAYTFADSLAENAAYNVTIAVQPAGQECQLVNASGTLTAAVSNIDINCGNVSTVGGTVSGLSGSLALSLNGGADQTISADGAYTFDVSVAQDAAYSVAISSQPAGQICTLSNASGTAASNITNVDVSCVTAYTISGTAAGIGETVELSLGTQTISVAADGAFSFSPIATGTAYTVAISQAPVAYNCSLTNESGTASADVSNVTLNCAIKTYTISGTATGVAAAVVLSNNGGDDLNISADGSFNFVTSVNHGAAYAVTVKTQAEGQTCTLSNASGTATDNVSDITLNCGVAQYQIGGSVSGLNGSLVLSNNGGDDLTVSADGIFNFASTIAHNASYTVSIKTQPVGQVCSLANETAVATADVSDIAVSCVTNTYAIGGTVANLNGSLVLTNNGGDDLTLSADGNLQFVTEIAHGSAYSVAVKTQPANQICSVSNAAGTATAAVSNVAVSCVNQYDLGGSVSGLTGSVVLTNNGGDDLTVSADGNWQFATQIAHDSAYSVAVKTQPANQICSVSNATGTATAAVSNVAVSCVNQYDIGGSISGLSGSIVLTNNGGDDLTVNANGNWQFATQVAQGGAYSVAIKTQPASQVCSITNDSGTATANVGNVSLSCVNLVTIQTNGNCITRATGDLRVAGCNSSDVNQQWKIVSQSGNNISIQSADSSQCASRNGTTDFDVNNGCPAAGDTSNDEIFEAQASGSGYRLKSTTANVCMYNLSGRIGGALGNCGVSVQWEFFIMGTNQEINPITGANL